MSTVTSALGTAAAVLAAVLAAAATWWAWLSWDSGYRTDPVTGAVSGPYAVWQVAGCVLTLLVVGVVAGWFLPPWFAAPAITLAFTTAWTVHAAGIDESGLYAVGALLLLVGLAGASALVCTAVWLVRRLRSPARG